MSILARLAHKSAVPNPFRFATPLRGYHYHHYYYYYLPGYGRGLLMVPDHSSPRAWRGVAWRGEACCSTLCACVQQVRCPAARRLAGARCILTSPGRAMLGRAGHGRAGGRAGQGRAGEGTWRLYYIIKVRPGPATWQSHN